MPKCVCGGDLGLALAIKYNLGNVQRASKGFMDLK